MGTRLPFTVSDLIAMDVFPPPLAADAWTRTYGPRLHETHTGRTGRSPEITCKSSSLGQVRGRPKAGQTIPPSRPPPAFLVWASRRDHGSRYRKPDQPRAVAVVRVRQGPANEGIRQQCKQA